MIKLRAYTYTEPARDGERKVVYQVGSKVCNGLVYIHSIEKHIDNDGNRVTSIYVSKKQRGEHTKWKEIRESKSSTYVDEYDWEDLLAND